MNVDEIKNTYSMADIVSRYGFHPNRAGFISCPFHKGDNSPSMKVYQNDYHCHACGANGDIFSFIQGMEGCDFKTAFYQLGGTYEKPTFSSRLEIYRSRKKREVRAGKKEKLREKMMLNNMMLTVYSDWLKRLEPLSDAWCDCMNAHTDCRGIDEYLQNQWEEVTGS